MPTSDICPICEKAAPRTTNSRNPSASLIDCPRCGRWETILQDGVASPYMIPEPRHVLSAWLRERYERTKAPFRLSDRVNGILPSGIADISVPEKIDRALLLLANRSGAFGTPSSIDLSVDYPLVWGHDLTEMMAILEFLRQKELFSREGGEGSSFSPFRCNLTGEGWKEVNRLRPVGLNSDQAFVAMQFRPELDEAFENGFMPALQAAGYKPYRVDRDHYAEKIDDHVIAQIRRSGLVVADCTGLRSSVLFEAGFAMGLGVPIVWTCRSDEFDRVGNEAFDTRQYPFIRWVDAPDLRRQLQERIEALYPRSRVR
jgi:nucleoside 2-deoxyribosyltransferase